MPPCFSLRDWYESDKSCPTGRKFSTIYLPTPVSPFHPEPLQVAEFHAATWSPPCSSVIRSKKTLTALSRVPGFSVAHVWGEVTHLGGHRVRKRLVFKDLLAGGTSETQKA